MMLEDETSYFPPERMRRICPLLSLTGQESSDRLREDLLRVRRGYLLHEKERNDVVRISQVRRQLRSGIKILEAAAGWQESLSGLTEIRLEAAILSKADTKGSRWSREFPGIRLRRGRTMRKAIIDYHRDILEGIPWLLENIKECEADLEKDKGARSVDHRNQLILNLMIVFQGYTGKSAVGKIICDDEGYRGITLDFVVEVFAEIDPQHGLSTGALGGRVRRIADAVGEELPPDKEIP